MTGTNSKLRNPKFALRQAVLVTLGATTTFAVALDALHWIDDLTEGK